MKIIILILSVAFSALFALRNAYQFKEGTNTGKPNDLWHLYEWFVKLCFALLVFVVTPGWTRIAGLFMVAAIDFLVFPIILNAMNGQRWDYLSNRGVDRWLGKIPSPLLFTLKMIILIISVTFYLK